MLQPQKAMSTSLFHLQVKQFRCETPSAPAIVIVSISTVYFIHTNALDDDSFLFCCFEIIKTASEKKTFVIFFAFLQLRFGFRRDLDEKIA
jgi:hypothetical protein